MWRFGPISPIEPSIPAMFTGHLGTIAERSQTLALVLVAAGRALGHFFSTLVFRDSGVMTSMKIRTMRFGATAMDTGVEK